MSLSLPVAEQDPAMHAEDVTMSDCISLSSDDSAAVVSVYNSWSESGSFASSSSSSSSSSSECWDDDDETTSLLLQTVHVDDSFFTTWTAEELYEELQKRLSPEDLPVVPVVRRTRSSRPRCRFINFMGTRTNASETAAYTKPTSNMKCPSPLSTIIEEPELLYPFISSKLKHTLYGNANDQGNIIDEEEDDDIASENMFFSALYSFIDCEDDSIQLQPSPKKKQKMSSH
jgi:hypothetical protein